MSRWRDRDRERENEWKSLMPEKEESYCTDSLNQSNSIYLVIFLKIVNWQLSFIVLLKKDVKIVCREYTGSQQVMSHIWNMLFVEFISNNFDNT